MRRRQTMAYEQSALSCHRNRCAYKTSAAMLSAIRSAASWREIARQMGVAGRRLDVAVAEQLADDRQGLAERQRPGSEGMAEIVQPDILQSGPRPDGEPEMSDSAQTCFWVAARKHPGTVDPARQGLENADRGRGQLDRAGTSLGVGQVELAGIEVDILPAQGQDFVLPASGQHQQTDRRYGWCRRASRSTGSPCLSRQRGASRRNGAARMWRSCAARICAGRERDARSLANSLTRQLDTCRFKLKADLQENWPASSTAR